MKVILTIATAALALGVPAPAGAAPSPHFERKPYAALRAQLIRSGYRPVRFVHPSGSDYCADGQPFCRDYPETIYCSGTGASLCQFAFVRVRDHKYFVVSTAGEERPVVLNVTVATRQMRSGWDPMVR